MTMNTNEARAFLTWANQHDPRVEPSPVNAEIWAHALGPYYPEQVKEATLRFFTQSTDKVTPAAVRTLVQSIRTSEDAKRRALEPTPREVKNPRAYRARNPELWDQLVQQGKRERDADLRRRGVIA